MRNLSILLLLLLAGFQLSAQQKCDCKAELDFVYEQIKITESYKYQIKGEMVKEHENTYRQLRTEISEPLTKLQCFKKLTQLQSLIKDKHAVLMESAPGFKVSDIYDSTFTEAYQKTEAFRSFPKTDRDLTALRTELAGKAITDIEGIYNIGSRMKMGVYRIDETDSLVGVMLDSKLGTWAPGQIYLYMTASNIPNHYDIISYSQVYKVLTFKKLQLVQHGILFSNVVKEKVQENYVYVNSDTTKDYTLRYLTEDVQYVWLNNFGRGKKNAAKRDALIAQMGKELKAKNLIVDLRNNGGGASKISYPIVRQIKKYAQKGNVYVLTNMLSGSNAEQTTLRLMKMADAKHLGQKTYGAIAYGRNYGTVNTSPSGLFQFLPTDMKFNNYLKYEEIGVDPEIKLNPDSDWVQQTINIINAQNQ